MRDYRPVRTKPPRSGPPSVAKHTSAVFADLAQRTKYIDPKLGAAWTKIAGSELAALCRPGRLTGGRTGCTLEVFAPNAAAAAKVQFEAETLRRKVNDFLGPDTVARISVRHKETQTEEGDPKLGAALSRFRSNVANKTNEK